MTLPARLSIVTLGVADLDRSIAFYEALCWGGTSGYFADPDGHPWEVAHNPGFSIDEDGRVRIP